MPTPSKLEETISRIISISTTAKDGELEQGMAKCLADGFGIDKVTVIAEADQGMSSLYDYVLNTKRPYLDNQMSEYSSFPELISYWNRGHKSCAILPVMVGGRVVSLIELLSKEENKFGTELMGTLANLAYLIGLSISYRKEESKSTRLAGYFNAAFDSYVPQIILGADGSIIRFNSAASSEFGSLDLKSTNIESLLGVPIKAIRDRSKAAKKVTIKYHDKTYSVHLMDTGQNLSYLAILDITEKELLSGITKLMGPSYGSVFISLDPNLKISYSTPSIKKIIGYDSALTASKNILDLIAERDKGLFKDALSAAEKSNTSGAVAFMTDRGTLSQVKFAMSKGPNGYMLLLYDSSAEKYVESMGQAFNEFLDGTSDIALKVDELGYITYANHAVEGVLGYGMMELKGKEIKSIYQDPTILEQGITYARNGHNVDNLFAFLISKDGSVKDATNSIRFFRTGVSSEYVIIAKELETKRRMQDLYDQIEEQKADIKKLDGVAQLKSQFIYNISHELKTPLTNIIGFSKLLYGGSFGEINEDQKSQISTIIEEAGRLADMIQQVLDAARLDSNKMKLDLNEISLSDMGENVSIKSLEEAARNKGLEFSWTVHYDVPAVKADYGRLIQVFINLIGNSIKFTDTGSVKVDIIKKNKNSVECGIYDTGIGVPEPSRHRLFREFYGAPSKSFVKQGGSGTGLGLSITKKIVELHGGKIGYEPRESGGSKFWFTLPVKGKRQTRSAAASL